MVGRHDDRYRDDDNDDADENVPLINRDDADADARLVVGQTSEASVVAGRRRRHQTATSATRAPGTPTMAEGTDSTGPDGQKNTVNTTTTAVSSSSADDSEHPDAPITFTRHRDAPNDRAQVGGNSDNDTTLQVEDDSGPSTPRFMQDENAWKRWKWVPYPVRRMIKAVRKWSRGPPNPQPYRIKPIFPMIQESPLWLVERFLPQVKHRFWVLFFYFSIWVVTFALLKRKGNLATEVAGWGEPQTIGCGDSYWGDGNNCGVDGNNCRPFSDSGFAFRCSANCASYHVLNPKAVGDQEVIYQSLIVGGPPNDVGSANATYRGDSFICAAAIHAGIISNSNGGCGVVKIVGQQKNFISSQQHGITSVSFDSYFPLAFQFEPDVDCSSQDMRWSLLALSAVFTGVLSLFTASPALFYFPIFTCLFWTTGMALDPPSHRTIAGLVSNLLGKFLPAMFCAWVMYDKMGVRRTLKGLTAQVEKTILWLGACWVGTMTNYTLDFIPIQRLNKHDLEQQPGARGALATIIIILAAIILSQVWYFRQEGRFIKYIKLYALLVASILISLTFPSLNLRIHHYILALLLLPGTSLQTRPSLLYQGLLVGLFINGIARWGFDPVLQTSAALQGDAQKGTRLPVVPEPVIDLAKGAGGTSNITFNWDEPDGKKYDGVSILVNDVERFRGYFADAHYKDYFTWSRNSSLDLPEYFRFAFMDGSMSGDYTKAGVWNADGEWRKMKPGPSRRSTDTVDAVQRLRH